ncbi:hypothetical protein AALP_AA3G120800 [Arabis alpina]|uniref:Uncharacterized protein n=1 Tax=Arabis alpina TaxID=50452 RepID=A0A087H8P3_ARAAL|nr:hypothetical protein AALP_AA3G120800 [Arabis alpina]
MRPNHLRTIVTQVTGGGRSVVTSRNFSSRHYELQRRGFTDEVVKKSFFDLFIPKYMLGFCTLSAWEFIQMVEYRQTLERSIEEHRGIKESKVGLRSLLRWLFFE